ncbi:MAG: hypothetical protein R8N24_01130 [Alphaproteobacteria bacterium]|nr:hypothetical protein [Alphaproteobacteria bacterium]
MTTETKNIHQKPTNNNHTCGGYARHCKFEARPFKLHKITDCYIPTINGTPTEQHSPFSSQAFFFTVEACIQHAEKVSKTCTRHYLNKSR